KAARMLPIKGKTQKARRKTIERGLKIASMSPEGEAAVRAAGLDDNRAALREIANEETAEAQTQKVKAIAKDKAKGKASMRGFGKRKTKAKRMPLPSSLSADEKKRVKGLLKMWHDAHDLNRAFAKETPAVHEGFFEKLRQSVADNDNEPEDDLEADGHDEEVELQEGEEDHREGNWGA